MIYCSSCDKIISQKFLTKHNKSKTHLYFHNNFVINKSFIYHNANLKNIILESTSKINNVTLTIFSKYKSIKRNHLLSQPRPVLESKILKHIHNLDICDKLTKYYFLSKKFNITF